MSTTQSEIPIVVRLGCLAGSAAGAVLGGGALLMALIFTGYSFGLDNALPVVAICAGLGAIVGMAFPTAAGRAATAVLSWF
jgi:hypothetical protein